VSDASASWMADASAGAVLWYNTPVRCEMGDVSVVSENVLKEIVERLRDRFQAERVILFGSQARGTADDRSDVDVLVVCPIRSNRRRMMVEMDRALSGLGIARDIIVLAPEEYDRDRLIPGTVARPAWLEGRVLYERG